MQSEASTILLSVTYTYKSCVNLQLKDHIYILILIKGLDCHKDKTGLQSELLRPYWPWTLESM